MMHLYEVGPVMFPPVTGLNINMMPFVFGNAASLPRACRHYWPLILACGIGQAEDGQIGYLSIMETVVAAGTPQRRPGIHTDGHPQAGWGRGAWGRGALAQGQRIGGLYMASTVEASCRAWDYGVEEPGEGGDCERWREMLEQMPAIYLKANMVYWMTDRCPHESLACAVPVTRQWFRVVTHAVDVWYAEHSTPNPQGIFPTGTIVYGNKFRTH